MLERVQPGPTADVGLRFGLSAVTFASWWYAAILPKDAEEFVKVHGGNEDGARMVCAIDYLTNIDGRQLTPDIIVRSYCYARDFPDDMIGNASIRYEAQDLYDHPAVQSLYSRLRSRTEAMGEDIIRRLMVGKIQQLIATVGDTAEAVDPKVLSALFSASTQLMSVRARRETAEQTRRDKKSYRAALEAHDAKNIDLSKLPEPEETRAHLLMLREAYGPATFDKLLDSVRTIELTADA